MRAIDRVLCGLALIISATAPVLALELNPESLAKLKAGEPIVVAVNEGGGPAAGSVNAVIDVPARPSAVWKVLTDCEISVRVFSGLKSCKVTERDPAGVWDIREHVISPSMLLPSWRSVFRSDYTIDREIRFQRTEGDLKRLEGRWELTPQTDGATTRLTYQAAISVGGPIPSSLVKIMLETDLPKTLRAVRKAAMDGSS